MEKICDSDHVGNDRAYKLEQQVSLFSNASDIHGDLSPAYRYWSKHYVEPKLKQTFGIEDSGGFYVSSIEKWCQNHNQDHLVICSIGCGEASTEIDICRSLLNKGYSDIHFECIDIAEGAILRAQRNAENLGLKEYFNFRVGELIAAIRDKNFDVVIANQVLHHVTDLETLFSVIRSCLMPKGCFLTIDMIGRNGHTLWPEALVIADRLWDRLPDKYKYNNLFNRFEHIYSNWDNSKEGNEGIRSQDILELLAKNFEFSRFLATGNLAPTLLGRHFGDNFDPANLFDRDIIDTLGRLDDDLIKIGYLTPVLMYAMLANEKTDWEYYTGCSPSLYFRNKSYHTIFEKNSPISVNSTVEFGERNDSSAFLAFGFSSPEPHGVWTNSPFAQLSAPLRVIKACKYRLNLNIMGHICRGKSSVETDITIGKSRVEHFSLSKEGVVERILMDFDASDVVDNIFQISFKISDCRSPSDLGLSADVRRLGFFLNSFFIEEY